MFPPSHFTQNGFFCWNFSSEPGFSQTSKKTLSMEESTDSTSLQQKSTQNTFRDDSIVGGRIETFVHDLTTDHHRPFRSVSAWRENREWGPWSWWFQPTHLKKNILVKFDHFPKKIAMQLKQMFDLPPPRKL